MKKVLILFGKSNWETSQFPKDESNKRECYEYLYDQARKAGIELYRASYSWFDVDNNIFSHAHAFDGQSWQRVDNITPDLVYDKCNMRPSAMIVKQEIEKDYVIVNNLNFTRLIGNKVYTSLLFEEWAAKTFIVSNQEMLNRSLDQITTELAVLKPIGLSGGRGIVIDKKAVVAKQSVNGTMILQEFIDSSAGIAGVTNGRHDMRIILVDHEVIYASVRTPAEGKYLANIAQGGTAKVIEPDQIPDSVLPILEKATKMFSRFGPTVYSLDVMFTDGGKAPHVIELNAMFGLYFSRKNYAYRGRVYKALIRLWDKYLES